LGKVRLDKSGWCVWITGLPGSGKSVVADAFLGLLIAKGIRVQLLSSDELRQVMTPEPSYSLQERNMVYATLVYFARLLTLNGVNVVIDATGNLRRYRDDARCQIRSFFEVYLECPLDICIEREINRGKTFHAPKRIYSKALEGKAPTVPGVGQPYEPPLRPELTLDTTKLSPEQCAQEIVKTLTV
jgi:adenylylsulfate kinase